MPVLRINDPTLTAELIADLQTRTDVVAAVTGPDSIQISILGSYAVGPHRMAICHRARAWEVAQRAKGVDVRVEVE
jgi:hypothetical protein